MNNYILIGRIVKAHGIKGEVRIDYYADSLILLKAKLVLLSPDKKEMPCVLKSYKQHQNQVIALIESVTDRNQAEDLRGTELYIAKEEMQKIQKRTSNKVNVETVDETDVYIHELLDSQILYYENSELKNLGYLKDVLFIAGQEVWSIIAMQGEVEKEILLPAVPEFVQDIDVNAKKIIITPPEGLLEIYL